MAAETESKVLFRRATVVTMNRQRAVLPAADVLVVGDRIDRLGSDLPVPEGATVVDGEDRLLIPGFVQTHIHLCQTLFRGLADDLELLDWLRLRIWPLEGAHDADSLRASVLLGVAELLQSGTTTVLDMETVHHTAAALEALSESGIRAVAGKCMMDHGEDVPNTLQETTEASLTESADLLSAWHGKANGRIHYAFMPRFVVSCSDELLRQVAELSAETGVLVHTHAAENRDEVALVRRERGRANVEHLDALGLTGERLVLAHTIWVSDHELDLVAKSDTALAHCPTSNLKLGSGLARTPDWLSRGIRFGLGADGAPCNNNLDMFLEMRLAALIQKPHYGARAMPAEKVFELATLGGAKALRLEAEIGSIEPGKKADLVLLDWSGVHHLPQSHTDVYSHLVYQARASDVVLTMVDGRVVYADGVHHTIDVPAVRREAERAIARLVARSGIPLGRL